MRFLSSRRSRHAAAGALAMIGACAGCTALTSFDGLVGNPGDTSFDGLVGNPADASISSDADAAESADQKSVQDATNSKYAQAVLADSPVAYFRLDETSGTVAHDISPSNLIATYGSNVTLGQPSLLATDSDFSVFFPGINDAGTRELVTMARASVLETANDLTVEAWIQFTEDTTTFEIVSYGNTVASPFQPWVLQVAHDNIVLYTSALGALNGNTTLVAGSTYYVAATYSESAASVYVNGVLDNQRAGGPPLSGYDFDEGLAIGAGGHDDLPLQGVIDEVAIYTHVLSASQIQAHFNAGSVQ